MGLIKRFAYGCFSAVAAVLFVIVIILLIAVVVFLVRYELWEQENRETIDEAAVVRIAERENVSRDMRERIKDFQTSTVQRESVDLSCDMVNVIAEDIADEYWFVTDDRDVGVICEDRALDVYVRAWNMWWVVVSLWQRADGDVDLIVYDVRIGPFSVAGITFGELSGEMSKGMSDALETMTSGTYSGRKIEEFYITGDGLRITGIVDREGDEEETDDSGVDSSMMPSYNPLLAIENSEC